MQLSHLLIKFCTIFSSYLFDWWQKLHPFLFILDLETKIKMASPSTYVIRLYKQLTNHLPSLSEASAWKAPFLLLKQETILTRTVKFLGKTTGDITLGLPKFCWFYSLLSHLCALTGVCDFRVLNNRVGDVTGSNQDTIISCDPNNKVLGCFVFFSPKSIFGFSLALVPRK